MNHQKAYQQLTSSVSTISSDISNLLNNRKKYVDNAMNHIISSNPQLNEKYIKQITHHCQQYLPIKPFLQTFIKTPTSFTNPQSNFWQINQKTQRDLQRKLKNLKEIDNNLDFLIGEEIQMAGQIQSIQETIRGLLFNRKEVDHVRKAEPFHIQKEDIQLKLEQVKRKKDISKEQKLAEIKVILDILNQMKNLRTKRLNDCNSNHIDHHMIGLVDCFIKDLTQIQQNKNAFLIYDNNQKKMVSLINETNEKISKLTKDLAELFETQIKTIQSMNEIYKVKSQISFFQQKMIQFFEIPEQQLFKINESLNNYIQAQEQKSRQVDQIVQGINTTQDTIQIFQNIRHNIQTQTLRKRELLKKISLLTKVHVNEKQRSQKMLQKQQKCQSLRLHLCRYQKLLEQSAQQANVREYKNIIIHIEQVQRSLKQQNTQLQQLRKDKKQAMKGLYQQINNLQVDYRDLLVQMLPLARDHNFDNIRDDKVQQVDLYLNKLFSRLKILA